MVLEYQGLELGMRRVELFDNVQFCREQNAKNFCEMI